MARLRTKSARKDVLRRPWGWAVRRNGKLVHTVKDSDFKGSRGKSLEAAEEYAQGLDDKSIERLSAQQEEEGAAPFWLNEAVEDVAPPQSEAVASTKSVLMEAEEITNGERNRDYGHPLDNFQDIADMWTVILRKHRGNSAFFAVTPEEVALMMDTMKVSREITTPKRDNRVDGPGYWNCLQKIYDERERRQIEAMNEEDWF